jgi:hypothetical protein
MAIQNSELDFFSIKSQLQTYLEQQTEFQDYDFTASGLSNILDVLAHNTHINGLVANMAINESFLGSAQLRSSVVSHAESLGYIPKSRTASSAILSLSVVNHPTGPASLSLPIGTEFTSSLGTSVYTFTTQEQCTAQFDDGNYVFKNFSNDTRITVREGSKKTKTFIVGEGEGAIYVLPDDTLDVSTINVKVYDNYLSNSFQRFSNINDVTTVNADSKVFILRETANGQYEVFFSDGNILGTAPRAGNRIEVTYITSRGSEANGAEAFSTSTTVDGQPIQVSVIAASGGGAEKENVSSIKLNAPRSFAAQNRLVTADDYTALISKNYGNFIRDVIAWGGNDNIPKQFGKVFVSLNFLDGVAPSVEEEVKQNIKDQLTSNLSIMSIDTEFVAPEMTFLELTTVFNIDPLKSPSSTEALQAQVDAFIRDYMDNVLGTFESVFRRSNLLTQIDSLSSSILNSKMSVKVQQRIDLNSQIAEIEESKNLLGRPLLSYIEKDHTIKFPFLLAEPDKDDHTINSSVFKSNGKNVVVKNLLGSTQLQLQDLDGAVVINNIGTYDPVKGTVLLNSIRIDKDGYVGTGIRISAVPANQSTISPLRNYIITLDESVSSTTGYIDAGATRTIL